jgi:hypothetical protein
MAMEYWADKTCGACGHVSETDLPKYTCQECATVVCPVCGGKNGVDENGALPLCRKCGMKRFPAIRDRLQNLQG